MLEAREVVTSGEEFAGVLRAHLVVVGQVARRFAPAGQADEVAQEALEAAWRYRSRFDPNRGSFRAWLVAIVLTETRRARSRTHQRTKVDAAVRWGMAGRPSQAADPGEEAALLAQVEQAMAGLSLRQRQVVGLYYFVDLAVDEVAQAMGISTGTVKSTLADARTRMRQALADKE
jgi:RNA polymerase sigma-70 factor (ECF subfamily)